jgi:nucleotide-binding universal stress UspA family protein
LDNSTDFDESVDRFIEFNKHFKAATDFIHIKKEESKTERTKNALISQVFNKKEPEFAFTLKNIYGGDIVQSIVDYSIFEKADMLVMVHRKRSFLDSIFKQSVSLRTAEGIHLPIMVLEENPPVSTT